MTAFFLNESDVRAIQSLLDRVKHDKLNTDRFQEDEAIHQAPEVYVAKTPLAGIAAVGGPYGSANNAPGSAACDIYQILIRSDGPKLSQVVDLNRTVYNVGSSSVPGDTWVPVARDKYGRWLVLGTTGGTNHFIDFEVREAGCPDFAAGQSQWVYAEVIRVPCFTIVEPGDIVQIFDPDEHVFNLPVDLLVGARGTAFLMRNDGFTNIVCAVVPYSDDACVWIAHDLHCREEVYSAFA